ncbi:MAG: response regulator transcription factor [Lewinellaceae bacterium]|nr:response regulator transcription factor [Phaeodactylibacter sp.]MCB9349075.1 response regulator transcription factor [Lewinellaceae bacterium]
MKHKYTYIVIEDVELQRENLIELLNTRLGLALIDSFENAEDAYNFLANEDNPRPDLIFLDIEMPGASGFNLLDAARRFCLSAKVIITTAFAEYAIKGYEYNISGYLLKPIEHEKLNLAIDKAIGSLQHSEIEGPAPVKGHILIKEKGKWVKVNYDEILYCEGANVDVKVVTVNSSYLTRDRVKNMVELLPTEAFMRIHDSFIINLDYVKSFAGNYTFVELTHQAGAELHRLRIGPKYRDAFRERMKERWEE